jgi:hypothetical protein
MPQVAGKKALRSLIVFQRSLGRGKGYLKQNQEHEKRNRSCELERGIFQV